VNFNVIDVDQRSIEWHAARLGRLTSSCANAVMATGRGGDDSAQRKNLIFKLALERITGKPQERYFRPSYAIQHGIEHEPEAFAAYEAMSGRLLTSSGFLQHKDLMAGTSLDGHTPDFTVIIEAKAPEPPQHFDYVLSGKLPLEYFRQCLHHFWIVDVAQRCDWFSYCPEFPEHKQTKLVSLTHESIAPINVKKDEQPRTMGSWIAEYDKRARGVLEEVDALVNSILTTGDLRGQLEASLHG
jgi:hypothetical protein